jgi:hypothetical protein
LSCTRQLIIENIIFFPWFFMFVIYFSLFKFVIF